jgi:hypothetical protein
MIGMHALRWSLLAVVLACLATACGGRSLTVPPATPAPPQQAELHWVEQTPANAPGLVFEVRRFAVTPDGWRADVGIRNDSHVPWKLSTANPEMFGLMLFATGRMEELDRRNKDGSLPGLRRARLIVPSPPEVLEPGARWTGTISAPGALAAGRWVRLVFGPLGSDDPPPGLPRQLVWITDRTLVLRG